MTKKTNEPSGWNPVFEFPLDDRNTIIIDGVKYKRVEEPKSPVEEAYKRVYGFYPETYEDSWSAFQDGYIASQKDYKVGEYQPTPQEPEELKTLYQMMYDRVWIEPCCDEFCNIVKEWMSQYADNVMCGEYKKGYEYCLLVLEENLK